MSVPTDDLLPTRATLIHRLKDWQDQSSWQVFFDTYWKLIFGVAIKAGLSQAEAQDVVQETMITVFKTMPSFRYDPTIGSFKAWLLNMTRWRITDHIRKRDKRYKQPAVEEIPIETQHLDLVIDPASVNLEELWNVEWEKNLLDAALAKVKRQVEPQKYQVFDFCVNKNWPAEKVAETFGVSIDQVYLIKHRITNMIKDEVKLIEAEIPGD